MTSGEVIDKIIDILDNYGRNRNISEDRVISDIAFIFNGDANFAKSWTNLDEELRKFKNESK